MLKQKPKQTDIRSHALSTLLVQLESSHAQNAHLHMSVSPSSTHGSHGHTCALGMDAGAIQRKPSLSAQCTVPADSHGGQAQTLSQSTSSAGSLFHCLLSLFLKGRQPAERCLKVMTFPVASDIFARFPGIRVTTLAGI